MFDPLSLSIPISQPRRPVGPPRRLLKPSDTHPDDYILELDYSSLSKYMECPRQFENYLIHGREADSDSVATSFGRLFHECEELRLRYGGWSEAVTQRQQELILRHYMENPVNAGEYRTGERMIDLLRKYQQHWQGDGWESNILQLEGEPVLERAYKIPLTTIPINSTVPYGRYQIVEYPAGAVIPDFAFPLRIRNIHVVMTGRIDLVLHDLNNLWIVDHKTTSRGGSEFYNYFFLTNQTRGYAWAAQQLVGRPIAGLLLNAIEVRPITRTGKAEVFDRPRYEYSEYSLNEWRQNAIATVSDIAFSLQRGYFPQYARSFKSPCIGCDYHDNCKMDPKHRAADLATQLYRDVTWNPITLGE